MTHASDPAIDGREIVPDTTAAAEVATGEPTAGGSRRSVLFLAGSLAGGNLVAMGMRLAGGILLGRLVEPSTLGLFAGIGLVLGYASIAQMGVLNGVNRELPYHMGRGDIARAHTPRRRGAGLGARRGWRDLRLPAGRCGLAADSSRATCSRQPGGPPTRSWRCSPSTAAPATCLITFRTSSEFVRLARVQRRGGRHGCSPR